MPDGAQSNTSQRTRRWHDDTRAGVGTGQAVQDCGPGMFKIGKAQDGLGFLAIDSGAPSQNSEIHNSARSVRRVIR